MTNNSLMLEQTKLEDSGNYSCIVENPAGLSNFSYDLNVLAAPDIKLGHDKNENELLKSIAIVAGRLFETECIARGNPIPRVDL